MSVCLGNKINTGKKKKKTLEPSEIFNDGIFLVLR